MNKIITKIKKFIKRIRKVLFGDFIKISGYVKIDHRNSAGDLLSSTGWMKNTITNAALAVVSGLVGNVDTQTAFAYLALGTDSTAESAAHTALQAEISDGGLERAAATVSRQTTNQTNDTLQLYRVWTATGSKTIEEIGTFNDASAGSMLGRKLTTTKTVTSGDAVVATYKFVFS